jgi:hypothetical protein
MSETINHDRRHFVGTAVMALAAAELGLIGSAEARSGTTRPSNTRFRRPGTLGSFRNLKQIHAGVLDVGYAEEGPTGGSPVILLHGWPYDIHSFVDVTPCWRRRGIG